MILKFFYKHIVLFSLLLIPKFANGFQGTKEIFHNNSGVRSMTQGDVEAAKREFAKLLAKNPGHPIFKFNLGGVFLVEEDLTKARKMFEEINKMNGLPPEVAFATRFNLGFLMASEAQFEEALEHYQAALDINPQSVEVKTNIELLIQQKKQGGGDDKNKKKDKSDKEGDDKKGEGEEPDDKEKGDDKPMTNKNEDYKPEVDGKNMKEKDVKDILDELQKDEQKIRAKHNKDNKRKKGKGQSGNNW